MVLDVGEVFFGQVVELNEEQLKKVDPTEWEEVAACCNYTSLGGQSCSNLRADDSPYCEEHLKEFSSRTKEGNTHNSLQFKRVRK